MEYKCHVYKIPQISNMRDLGGYVTKDGKVISMGRFIRSTALNKIGINGKKELSEIGIDCVIDLRSTAERKQAPDVIENSEDIHFLHVPMLDYISSNFAVGDFSDFPKTMYEMYIGLLERGSGGFKRVFEQFADERFRSYLFHCTAGKDRTGITAMLLLGLAGVDDDTIIEDYSYTETLLHHAPIGKSTPDVPRYLFESSPDTMRITLDFIKEKYGNIINYLESIGIDAAKQKIILSKLFL